MRPKGITLTSLLMGVFNLLGYAFIEKDKNILLVLTLASLIVVISYIIILFYWKGYNWARWLVIAASLLSVINVFWISGHSIFQKIIILSEAGFGVFLLYWLNTAKVRGFFTSKNGKE